MNQLYIFALRFAFFSCYLAKSYQCGWRQDNGMPEKRFADIIGEALYVSTTVVQCLFTVCFY